MSVFEPHTDAESGGRSQLPPLDVPLRGRKGQQVTAYIQDLATRLGRQRTRAEQAEQAATHLQRELAALRNQPPPSFEHLGSEAAKVLEGAGRSAKVLVEEAKGRGKVIIEQAKAHAGEVVDAAEQRAKELEEVGRQRLAEAEDRRDHILAEANEVAERLRASADHDAETRLDAARQAAEQMLAKADGERSVMDAETKRLQEYRDGLLGHLSRVEADLSGFLADVSDLSSPDSAQADREEPRANAKAAPGRQDGPADADAEDADAE